MHTAPGTNGTCRAVPGQAMRKAAGTSRTREIWNEILASVS